MMRHWTSHMIVCQDCGEKVFISQEAIDESRANDPDDRISDGQIAGGLAFCLQCAGTDEPGSVAGERDGMLHHPTTGQSVVAVAHELVREAARMVRVNPEYVEGLSHTHAARLDAELYARHGRTAELREFYAAVAASLSEG